MPKLAIGALAALAVATPAFAQPMQPAAYVMAAGASDLFEQQSSQIALESTTNPDVRAFAMMMIEDHGKSTAEVKAAAKRAGVTAGPPMLMPVQAEKITELRAAQGPARDAVYIAQQRAAHGQALSVQKAYAKEGTAAPLRAAAGSIVPVVEHHIEMLKRM